ncbi:MAG: hypothetical protein KC415_07040, partial [Anaerolineales bacterium]|nr:hypothetical protein [Anaerolineales bacterium]
MDYSFAMCRYGDLWVEDDVIQRGVYMLGGVSAGSTTVVAVRVTGDLDIANNGLFYLYSDHLGSASAMT